jgi:hypothetical protein
MEHRFIDGLFVATWARGLFEQSWGILVTSVV